MVTREQLAVVASTLAFLGGLALVAFAVTTGNHPRLADMGAGVTLGSLPFVILAKVRKANHINRDMAETIRREGYRLGLEHAGRGLLNPPPIHDNGEGAPRDAIATVHRLYAVSPQQQQDYAAAVERKQQAR
ncbi:hypothetical protein [Streptomyces sp. NPDC059970]|uniref:hypothetical protein n=1 Tax=Streptomyces sp. NPDC059970 TaxID=3347019 RepID=UPI0036C239AA